MKHFAKFAVLGTGLLTVVGCTAKEDKPVPYRESRMFAQAREQQPQARRSESRSPAVSAEIADRLQKRENIAEELENVRGEAKMASYRCQLVQALVLNGTVSQVPGEYDTVVIGHLADYARTLDVEPAAHAVASLMAIARIPYGGNPHPQNRSVKLAMAALKDALKNPTINADTRQAINEFLADPEAITLQSLVGNMPPCCETPQKLQAAPDSLALQLYRELVPNPEARRQLYEQMKREHPEQFRR